MIFNEPEVIEMGFAEELIQDLEHPDNSEGTTPSMVKTLLAVYLADAE